MLLINVLLIYIGKIFSRMPILIVITIKGMTMLAEITQQNDTHSINVKKLYSAE
jgi:hypothetical protein